MKIVSVLILSLAFYFLNPATTFSQATNSGFTLSPPFKEITLEKEASQSSYFIEVINDTPAHQTLYLSVVDFGSLDESGGVAFLGNRPEIIEKKYSLASWVNLEKDVLEIEKGKSQKIKVTLVNKESLSPGGHYAAVVAGFNSPKEEGNISLNTALASLIFVKKTGGEIYRLDLVEKEIQSRLLGLPNKIALRFQNSGNVHLVPRGTITITDPNGSIISKGIINQESGIILPESFRLYHTNLERLALPILPGFYTINTQYRYEGKEDFIKDSTTFFFLGIIGIVILIIIIVIISFILIKNGIKRYIKSVKKERKE